MKLVISSLSIFCASFAFANPVKTIETVLKTAPSICEGPSKISGQFIVRWEDGHISVEKAKNERQFLETFVRKNLKLIKRVENDFKIQISNGEFKSQTATNPNWGPEMIKAASAWEKGIYGDGILIGVVDGALDYNHSQLKNNLAANLAEMNGLDGVDDDGNGYVDDRYGWDFVSNKPEAQGAQLQDHGTLVAGIVAAEHSAGEVKGVAPRTQIIPASFIDQDGGGSFGHAILAIRYAVSRGAKIINASWGGSECSQEFLNELKELDQKGILLVTAAGNDGVDFDHIPVYSFPAVFNLSNQITVAATNSRDQLASFSNRSASLVHIGAPGVDIQSTAPIHSGNHGTATYTGTSFAAPFVTGAAALLWSAKPEASAFQVKQALLNSADFRSYEVSSQGRLNVEAALSELDRILNQSKAK